MTNQTPNQPDRLDRLEETVASQGRTQTQTDEILLLLARRYQEHEQSLQEVREILDRTARRQELNAQQIAANAEAIADLQVILRDRFSNGHSGDRP